MWVVGSYRRFFWRRLSFGIALLLILILASIVSISLGTYKLGISELLIRIIEGDRLLWNIRIPRVVSAVIVGGSLALSGAVMQCVLRNPLASPFTLGVSQGAAFGAGIAIALFGAGQMHKVGEPLTIFNLYIVPFFAFLGSLSSALIILVLAKIKDLTAEAMILAGVAMSALFQAGVMLIQYFVTDVQVASIVFWTFGDVGRTRWKEIYIMLIAFLACFAYFLYRRWDYNSLLLGDETAVSLGTDPKRVRLESMVIASFLTSVCVSFNGVIGFVGLVAPQIVRIAIGGDYRFLIPSSALVGALILLISDTVGRIVISPVIIPSGVITSMMGAPVFIYFLLRGGRGVRG